MLEATISIKPLSVNKAWQGRRFKTPAYKSYEKELLLRLQAGAIPQGELSVSLEWGFSNAGSDIDNPIKPVLDILQKKYGFNDSKIYDLQIKKTVVAKGDDYIKFKITEKP